MAPYSAARAGGVASSVEPKARSTTAIRVERRIKLFSFKWVRFRWGQAVIYNGSSWGRRASNPPPFARNPALEQRGFELKVHIEIDDAWEDRPFACSAGKVDSGPQRAGLSHPPWSALIR